MTGFAIAGKIVDLMKLEVKEAFVVEVMNVELSFKPFDANWVLQ